MDRPLGQLHPVDQLTVARTIRTQLITIPGRLINHAGIPTLRAAHCPWAHQYIQGLSRIRALPNDVPA
jgi:hypothetical protein